MPEGQQNVVFAALREAFIKRDCPNAVQMLPHCADQLRDKRPKLSALIDESETDVLAHTNIASLA